MLPPLFPRQPFSSLPLGEYHPVGYSVFGSRKGGRKKKEKEEKKKKKKVRNQLSK